MRTRRPRITAVLAVTGAALALPGSALASASREYVKYGISNDGAPIAGLPAVKGYPSASVLAPQAWKVVARRPGSITLLTDKPACPYRVTFTTRWVAGPSGGAADHVTAALPVPRPAYLEDWGTRRSYAWRVIRAGSSALIKGLQAVEMPQTTVAMGRPRFPGLPAGDSVWRELSASAPMAKPGAVCHSGFYREVARQVGDALADNVTAFK